MTAPLAGFSALAIDAASASGKPVLVHAEVVSDDDAGLPAGADGMDCAPRDENARARPPRRRGQ